MSKKIIILGAGLVGSLLSILLAKKGHPVTIFEKRPDPRKAGAEGGRSINLALSKRGKLALKKAGLGHAVEKLQIPMEGRMIHDLAGNLTFQPYGRKGQEIYSISRAGLNALLMDHAEDAGVKISFSQNIVDVDLVQTAIKLENPNEHPSRFNADLIVGADGAYSAVREVMRKTDRFNYSQFYIDYGYKELTIPASRTGDFALANNALHIWPRGNYMLIALPNLDRSFTCTLFLPYHGEKSFEFLDGEEKIISFFTEIFPDVVNKMPSLVEDFLENPTGSLVTISCYPWIKNNAFLIGDAAHAIVPFYGQGMNAGFEDCNVLNNLLDRFPNDLEKVLQEFQFLRKPDADAISELALRNFVEMRDLVGDPQFLLRKKIEAKLHKLFPEEWIPLYSMVTFSDFRYSEALHLGEQQDKVMTEVMSTPDIQKNWETMDYQMIINKLRTLLDS